MKFAIKHRWSGSVLFEAEIAANDDTSTSIKLGPAVKAAHQSGAYLEGAYLEDIKADFFERLSKAKDEVQGLYDYLVRGKINGSVYEGECACFCGTIANIRHEKYSEMSIDLRPESSSATEKWFLAIQRGDTEQSSQIVKITADWMREFMAENSIIIPEYKTVSSLENPELFDLPAREEK